MQLYRAIVASLLGFALLPYKGSNAGRLDHKFVTADVTLSTSGSSTSVPLSIPAGSIIDAVAFKVLTPVAGISSDSTVTFSLTGGSTDSLGQWVATDLDEAGGAGNLFAPAITRVTGSAANGAFVVAGGADNTPSAGKIRLVIFYRSIAAL